MMLYGYFRSSAAFCHGEQPGLADIALVPQVVNAERYRLDLAPYPTIARIFRDLHEARRLCRSPSGAAARSRRMTARRIARIATRQPAADQRQGARRRVSRARPPDQRLRLAGRGHAGRRRRSRADRGRDAPGRKSYVVPVKPDQLVKGALKGMLSKLDPHSDYMTEQRISRADLDHQRPVRRGRHRDFGRRRGAASHLGDRRHAGLGRRHRARRPDRQGRRPADRRDGYRRSRPAAARQARDPGRADDRAGQSAGFRPADHPRHHSCRLGQVGAEAGRHRLCPDQHLRREHPGRAAHRAQPPAPAKPAVASPGLSSICATMPAASSIPPSRSPAIFSIPARW